MPAISTVGSIQTAVELQDIRTAGPLMQTVDVLGYQGQARYPMGQRSDGPMCRIGLAEQHLGSAPCVPTPDQRGIRVEGLRGGQLRGVEVTPQAAQGIAKGGNAALLRDAGAGEHQQMATGAQPRHKFRRVRFGLMG